MTKMLAITEHMTDTAKAIANSLSLIKNSQNLATKALRSIMVHFDSTPKVMSALHLANISKGYNSSDDSLERYQTFIIDTAAQYEWTDEQLARWAEVMLNKKGVDIYKYEEENAPNNASTYSYDAANYQKYNVAHGKNCYSFVNQVLNDQGRGSLSTLNGASLNGLETIPNGQKILGSGESMTGSDIQNIFANAKVGDVVQMKWGWYDNDGDFHSSCHTAIISGINENGVEFLHSNLGDGTVKNSEYTWDTLAKRYSYIGKGGGASIYRF